MYHRILFSILFSMVFACGAQAQWTKIATIPTSVDLSDIHARDNFVLAVGTRFSDFTPFFFVSEDGGQTWDSSSGKSGFFYETITYTDPNTAYLGGYGSISFILKSADGGNSWQTNLSDNSNTGVTEIQFLSPSVGYACGFGQKQFSTGNVYKTSDAGKTWIAQKNPMDSLPLENIQMLDEEYGYAWASGLFGYTHLIRTTDGGANWSLVYKPSVPGDFYWINRARGVMVDASGSVHITNDSGQNWQQKKTPASALSSVAFSDPNNGYAVGASGYILHTTNGGDTWEVETSPTKQRLTKVEYHGGTFYAIGSGVILRRNSTTSAQDENEDKSAQQNSNETSQSLRVYPNPTTDILHLPDCIVGSIVAIHDIYGKLAFSAATNAEQTIDISHLSSGAYRISIQGRSGSFIIKQ